MANILLLEPDRLLRRTYGDALQLANLTVHTPITAQAALTVLDQQAIDLIILEPKLPDHNGVELLYELRSHPDWDDIKVLIHSVVPMNRLGLRRSYWSQLGIGDYLYKPSTSLAELVARAHSLASSQPAEVL